MSESVSVPVGLDKLTPDEQRVFEAMRADDDAPAPDAAPSAPEPAAAPAPEPEIEIEDAPTAGDESKQKLVPHAQFHAANERRKAAEAKAAAAEQRAAVEAAKFAERLNLLTQAVAVANPAPATPSAPAVEIPDIESDPVGHFQAQLRVRDQKIADMEAIMRGSQEQQQRIQQATELRNWGAAQEQAMMAQEPSYADAMTFLQTSFFRELAASGVTDPAAQREIMGQNVAQIAARARAEGASFPQRLYAMAEARGFQKQAQAADVPTLETPPALDQAARVAAGRESALTIGSIGAAPPTRLSPEKIANMSDRDFGILVGKLKGDPAALRRLMGE